MDMTSLLVNLVSGAVGGNVAGSLLKDKSLGTVGNSIAGLLGGGIGGTILSSLGLGGGTPEAGMNIGSIVSSLAGGGAGGGVLMVVIGLIKNALAKKQ